MEPYKDIRIQIVAFYVLINSAFVGKIFLYLSKWTLKQQLKLTIKIVYVDFLYNFSPKHFSF
jgi:hypothetical protein